jgi:signal transduction histidine kinase
MIELINDLLNVARIEDGRFGMKFQLEPMSKFIGAVLDRLRASAAEKGVKLAAQIPADLPAAEIDADKMSIALENVIDNSIKYTAPGGKVSITAAVAGESFTITVADSGIGIPPDQLGRIFSKFFRADNALRFQTSGSGLGLYVVKNVLESHGGSVSLQSQERKGTVVTLTFPINRRHTL